MVLQTIKSIVARNSSNTPIEFQKIIDQLYLNDEKNKTEFLMNELLNGKSIAYASDAGTPAISDPGAFLVNQALKLGIKVSPIPGSSSLVAAFSISGIESTQFQFYGFILYSFML